MLTLVEGLEGGEMERTAAEIGSEPPGKTGLARAVSADDDEIATLRKVGTEGGAVDAGRECDGRHRGYRIEVTDVK